MATLFVDLENGDDNYSGTSFNPLASGTDGRISSYTFSSAGANFPNDGTIAPIKNLFGASEALEDASTASSAMWQLTDTTLTRSTITPPSGLFTTWELNENFTNTNHRFQSTSFSAQFTSGVSYTTSIYVKSNGRSQVTLQFTTDATRAARFDLSNGTVAQTGANATAAISGVGDGWYRISITATATSTGGDNRSFINLTNDTHNAVTAQTYLGDITKGVYISSPQVEANSSATSYEKPPEQRLSIWNGSSYLTYRILQYINSTSLLVGVILSGSAIANQSVDRQYYIGGRVKTITNGLPTGRLHRGDEVRIMASPDPTLVGNATFTSSKADITLRTISSSTNASPISITSNGHGLSTGDTVVITGHTTNTNANGTWVITVTGTNTFTLDNSTGNGVGGATGRARSISNCVVKLANAVTENIASFGNRGNGRTAWTAVAGGNASASLDTTDTKEGDVSDSISVTAAFTTGKVAHKATGTLNLSGYQQVSFWIKQTSGTAIVSGDISLRLCSDISGDTTVNTINIPGIVTTTRWLPLTVDLGSNLGSSIQSIALYVDTDRGAQTFLISNIIACKSRNSDDSLNLQSLIGKNTSSEKWWATTQSINGTTIILDQDPSTTPIAAAVTSTVSQARGYSGTSETTSLYKRETIKTSIASASNTNIQLINNSGTQNNTINFLFGYDRTNMSTQTGQTFMDGLNSWGTGLHFPRNFITVKDAGFVRYFWGVYILARSCSVSNLWFTGNSQYLLYILSSALINVSDIYASFSLGLLFINQSTTVSLNNINSLSNSSQGISMNNTSNSSLTNSIFENNATDGILVAGGRNNLIKNCIYVNNGGSGFNLTFASNNNLVLGCTSTNNTTSSVGGTSHGINYIKNCTLNEAVLVANFTQFSNGRTILIDNNGSSNNYIHYTEAGTIYNTTSVRYTNSGFAWALAPTSTTRSSIYPLDFPIAKVAVNSNSMVTVRAWMRRTNTQLTTGLRVKGGQINGVSNDITSYMTAAADTWEQVTLNFTPTEAGVVEILAECYGGSTFTAYVDDINITQV